MTLINFISGAIYTKDATFKEKIQLSVMALIFLILLYNSPSGLVIYWILNNLFSLVKNIVMKTKNPGKIEGAKQAFEKHHLEDAASFYEEAFKYEVKISD